MGYNDIKQQETYEKLKDRGWYRKWYWYFINATTADYNKQIFHAFLINIRNYWGN